MKMRKAISFATAAVLSIASLPILSAGAVDSTNYLLGDLDGDGRITGHDTAMLSYVMYDDYAKPLSEMQLFLADMDGNGEITIEDLNAIHEKEEAKIASFKFDNSQEKGFSYTDGPTIDAAYLALLVNSYEAIRCDICVCKEDEFPEAGKNSPIYVPHDSCQFYIREEVLVMLDADGDGKITLCDAVSILNSNSKVSCDLGMMYPSENRYDLTLYAGLSEEDVKKIQNIEARNSGMTLEEVHDYIDNLFENYVDPDKLCDYYYNS